ncbi:CocE/NonD family hydrolase [Amycolatopsis jejuensis]|uniref:CocE/NonD family hydrolase n=1 Tax=Amycolatopsis jejuensis TaxID=330084 RepID=UPI000A8F3437|nr:CocE/NonD family hydrolase [Amycolatopsis jejuensis]
MDYTVSCDVPVPMRDGIVLTTDVWRPVVDAPGPVLLVRTPYTKEMDIIHGGGAPVTVLQMVRAGYAVAVQDVRGTGKSEGVFVPNVDEGPDCADTIRWLAAQDWCDGKVGAWGNSYLGMVQLWAAVEDAPELAAIAPGTTSGDLYRAPWYSRGGAMSLGVVLTWGHLMSQTVLSRALAAGTGDDADLPRLMAAADDDSPSRLRLPVADQPLLRKYLPFMVERIIEQPERGGGWTGMTPIDRAAAITVPALHVGGWYDNFCGETLRTYEILKAGAGTGQARAGQRLIIGPWSHVNWSGIFPDRRFGPGAALAASEVTRWHGAFFDRWLRDREDALDGLAPVRIFVMGIDQWRDEDDWPLPDTRYVSFHLDGNGPANTAAGAGVLTSAEPVHDAVDTYLYNPQQPVPTLGGTLMRMDGYDGPADQRPVHDRDDVLVFTTGILTEPVEVTGPVTATLFVSSSAADTDFTVKLVDVHPDGRAIILCDGILRTRYREALDRPVLMQPGRVCEITVDLIATSNVFLPGHRILVEVSSSNFPRYDRNSNTGGTIAEAAAADLVVAANHLHRGPAHPSRITLPIIDRPRPHAGLGRSGRREAT